MSVEYTKNGKKLKVNRDMTISLLIAVESNLREYMKRGYTEQQIENAPEGSHFGRLLQFQAIAKEMLYG